MKLKSISDRTIGTLAIVGFAILPATYCVWESNWQDKQPIEQHKNITIDSINYNNDGIYTQHATIYSNQLPTQIIVPAEIGLQKNSTINISIQRNDPFQKNSYKLINISPIKK